MSCTLVKAALRERQRGFDESWRKVQDLVFSPIQAAKDKLNDRLPDILGPSILDYIVAGALRYGTDVKSAALWIIGDIIKASAGRFQAALTAKTLLLLKDDLDERVKILGEIQFYTNIVKTSVIVIANELAFMHKDENFDRALEATAHIKAAFINAKQILATWEHTNVFSYRLYNRLVENLALAQTSLVDPERIAYETELANRLAELEISGYTVGESINLTSLVEFIRIQGGRSDAALSRADVALTPLANFIANDIENRVTRVTFAYNLGLQALIEISKLLPYDPKALLAVAKGTGIAIDTAVTDVGELLFNVDTNFYADDKSSVEKKTLLEINGAIYAKMFGLKNIKDKWLNFDAVVAPYLNDIEEAAEDLRNIYANMKDTLNDPKTSRKDIISKRAAWSLNVEAVQRDLIALDFNGAEALNRITRFGNDWNSVLSVIDSTDLATYDAAKSYTEVFKVLTGIPLVAVDGFDTKSFVSSVVGLQRMLYRAVKYDSDLSGAIKKLNLQDVEYLDAVEDLYKFADDVFPLLALALANCDIDAIKDTLASIRKLFTSSEDLNNTQQLIMDSATNSVESLKNKIISRTWGNIEACFGDVGEIFNFDEFDFSFDLDASLAGIEDKVDNETEREIKHMKSFYDKKSGDTEIMEGLMDR